MLNKLSDKLLWIAGIAGLLAIFVIGWAQASLPMVALAAFVLGAMSAGLMTWQVVDRNVTTPDESKLEAARKARREKRKNGR